MTQYLDANGLNTYHRGLKQDITNEIKSVGIEGVSSDVVSYSVRQMANDTYINQVFANNATALGIDNIAGSMVFVIDLENSTGTLNGEGTYVLSSAIPEEVRTELLTAISDAKEEKLLYSIIHHNNYYKRGKITAISDDGMSVTVDKYVVDDCEALKCSGHTCYFKLVAFPNVGDTSFGTGAHSEGYSTKATAIGAHSEGYDTYAEGKYSHAEGRSTYAAYSSHSEGANTEATGNFSHAEGQFTYSTGLNSHSEGNQTHATGKNSHAEGAGTTASGEPSHAEGAGTTASGGASHSEGSGSIASGNFSHAEGVNTQSIGSKSHTEGNSTKASGDSSHSEGTECASYGNHSHSEGYKTTSGVLDNPTACIASHSEGGETTASGHYSHSEGYHTTAFGERSHSEGSHTNANGVASHAEGVTTTASGKDSHAEGVNTTASGDNSHAEGNKTVASGRSSHAEGEGDDTTKTIASGAASHSEGYRTTAKGLAAHSEGRNTDASHNYSHAGGNSTKTSAESQTVIGTFNADDSNALFIVGNGSNESSRKNAFKVTSDGKAMVGDDRTVWANYSNTTTNSTTDGSNTFSIGTFGDKTYCMSISFDDGATIELGVVRLALSTPSRRLWSVTDTFNPDIITYTVELTRDSSSYIFKVMAYNHHSKECAVVQTFSVLYSQID